MSQTKYIEIKGVNFVNKGAELMLLSIKKEILSSFPNAILCMNMRNVKMNQMKKQGIYVVLHYYSKKYAFINKTFTLINWIPQSLLNLFGVVKLSKIDVVLDASGFSYSDQWGLVSMEIMANYYKKLRRMGAKVIFMPQAFGPFENEKSKNFAKLLFQQADLIYARDKVSLKYLQGVVDGTSFKGEPYPDFTNLLEVENINGELDGYEGKVCIIPNYRMIDKGVGEVYYNFLRKSIETLHQYKMPFYFLIHETDRDMSIVETLSKQMGIQIAYLYTTSATEIKYVIGKSRFVIGSRFHGLISALSQGVPVIITGWSHKYEELAKDYGVEDFVITNFNDDDLTGALIIRVTDEHEKITKIIESRSGQIKARARQMWDEISDLINK